jgi:GcrA cell cycle regulator
MSAPARQAAAVSTRPPPAGGRKDSGTQALAQEGIDMTWTSDRVELLKMRFDAGLSCGQIAREIGVSRNAVIGKINRLGLARLKNVVARQPERRTAASVRPPRIITQHQILKVVRAEPQARVEETLIESGQRCSLFELNEAKCRWPISDPGTATFGFCGNEPVKGLPYCAGHARMAYQPAARQRLRA